MGGGRGGMRGDINEMFERLPVITVADLKVGDMIAVSSTKTDNPRKSRRSDCLPESNRF